VEFGDDHSMRFRATVITAPEFQLPDYKNIPVQLPPAEVTKARSTPRSNVCATTLRLHGCHRSATRDGRLRGSGFRRCDRRDTIGEIAPDVSKNVQGGKKFWLRVMEENFLPGFCAQIGGMNPAKREACRSIFQPNFQCLSSLESGPITL
jgi:trigger factor